MIQYDLSVLQKKYLTASYKISIRIWILGKKYLSTTWAVVWNSTASWVLLTWKWLKKGLRLGGFILKYPKFYKSTQLHFH